MPVTILHLNHDLSPADRMSVISPVPVPGVTVDVGESGPPEERLTRARVAAARALLERGDYHQVAEVATDDLEEAYRLTQNGAASPSWSRLPPPKVTPTPPGVIEVGGRQYGYKTTEVGDVLILNGRGYVVDVFGFAPLATES